MAKYRIEHIQEFNNGSKLIYYQGNNQWTTEYDHRKVYDKKADATAELYDFGGKVVKDDVYNPNPVDRDKDGIVQEGTEYERPLE